MIMADDYQGLLRQVEKLKAARDRAKGALGQITTRLKKEFGVKTVKEAKELLARLEEQERKAAEVYVKERKAFDKKWKKKLEDVK